MTAVFVADADRMFHLIALVIAASIVAHSSTEVLVARWFRRTEARTPGRLTRADAEAVR